MSSGQETSARTAKTLAPSASSSRRALSSLWGSRAHRLSIAPMRPRLRAMAWPTPRLAPVTSATLPSSGRFFVASLIREGHFYPLSHILTLDKCAGAAGKRHSEGFTCLRLARVEGFPYNPVDFIACAVLPRSGGGDLKAVAATRNESRPRRRRVNMQRYLKRMAIILAVLLPRLPSRGGPRPKRRSRASSPATHCRNTMPSKRRRRRKIHRHESRSSTHSSRSFPTQR